MGIFAPARTPPEIVARLNQELQKALQSPAVKQKLATMGVEPMPLTAAEFDAQVKDEVGLYAKFAKAAGLKPN
jgi:tripartite-type tricarboxylate transporter receptor subunit TctC